MNANELMIGDWIQIADEGYNSMRGQYHQIDWIKTGELGLDNRKIITPPYAEPIPLTPEILEKNGFGFTRNNNTDSVWNGWWIYEGLELAVANLNKEGNWPCFINIYDSNILCEYVHQLQHALRLCGIEKEIVLR